MAILKHYSVKVVYNDNSYHTLDFETQEDVKEYIDTLDLPEVKTMTVWPEWSKVGEVVPLKVHHVR